MRQVVCNGHVVVDELWVSLHGRRVGQKAVRLIEQDWARQQQNTTMVVYFKTDSRDLMIPAPARARGRRLALGGVWGGWGLFLQICSAPARPR